MTAEGSPAAASLGDECRVFTRYLVGLEPSEYVVRCYQRLCEASGTGATPAASIDRASLALARLNPLAARCADAYARRFRPYGILRRRLILVLAILENSGPSDGWVNGSWIGPIPLLLLRMSGTLLASGAALLAGVILLGPVQLVGMLGRRGR